ncbi:MAG TPA: hypothetical protein VM864_13125 [Pyrinomonadaceae bacterium]|jgi:hypothetical protein|nr:hypothetical protein [Pyrinomonadaceae bacterium]
MRRKYFIAPALILLSAAFAAAEQIEVRRVGELVRPSDLIARVKIVHVRETGAQEGYGRIAVASVVEALKGTEVGSVVELGSDFVNVVCPNVSYEAGEDVLLFAKKTPDGRYVTTYAAAGKISIKDGRVSQRPFRQDQSYRSAVAEVRREIMKLEGESMEQR